MSARMLSVVSWPGLILFSAALATADPPPATTDDGLQLQKSKQTLIIYALPGADFSQYQRVAVLDCEVHFEKDWQRDYNSSRVQPQFLKESDVERMKAALAAECKKVFAEELRTKGGYELVDVVAPDVLVLRPVLVNVEVSAPDLMTAGPGGTVVRSAGQMTLVLELWDPYTKTILARMMNAQSIQQNRANYASRASNKAAANKILRRWAEELRKHLEAVRAPAPG